MMLPNGRTASAATLNVGEVLVNQVVPPRAARTETRP